MERTSGPGAGGTGGTGETTRGPGRAGAAGADFLQLDPRQAPPGGLADWLARRLRAAVLDGSLPVGTRLPATRTLAAELRVSRGVVTDAYRRLGEDGLVAGRGRAGTVVAAAPVRPCAPPPPSAPAAPPPPAEVFAAEPGPDVFDLLRAVPARIDLTPGTPDLSAFPRAAWLRAERRVLDGAASSQLGYGDPRGAPALRSAVAGWLARNRGLRVDPDEVLITSGTAQTLTLFGQVLHDGGVREVAVEDPGALGARMHLNARGLATPPVPVDEEGVRVDVLRATGAPVVLLTPAHQFPTGVVLGGGRRRALMRWAAGGGLVVEDDYDAEHRYDRPPVPALRSVLPDRVLHCGSVSKLLAPALRLGWAVAPPRHREALVEARRYADLGSAALPQLTLARLMDSGELERHLRLLRVRHRRRRDAMAAAVRERLPGAVVRGAAAGLHLTVVFDAAFRDTDLAAAALERGVKTQPLSWHAQRPGPPGLVLGYAARTPGEIREAVAALGRVVRAAG
ncbi:PLP-dependent aminotransferase family protein [Streptomyces desertarenae]|uniref:PLP-dependent aminotransferase family protein n=2 Tax=Streptomyces TaxID=1883 RepID=A0ABW4PJE8_9ACTN